jgi:lipopolysaccharide export system permease protein
LTPINLAELSWRLGLILASFNFVIIGAAVSSVNPRAGRSANLVFALFTFVIYYNLLNLGQNWIAAGKFTFLKFVIGLHFGIFIMAIFWLVKGHNNWHWRQLFGVWLNRKSMQDLTV